MSRIATCPAIYVQKDGDIISRSAKRLTHVSATRERRQTHPSMAASPIAAGGWPQGRPWSPLCQRPDD